MKCQFCGYEAEQLWNLKRHITSRHLDGSTCPVCGKKTKRLLSHLQWAKDEEHQALYAVLSDRRSTSADQESRKYVKELRSRLVEV